ncbi:MULTISPECIES: hypothetical protein [unclassified Streptomyces]|uniref:hypothetical protein n=1 Tax=unclassified Streptomyces TaxID=2593676 RepID=UPI0022712BE4|nr:MULTISPECIES: hypothetical protein [unclassified Streptomyces]MCY0924444.1 hypothetical protein [Streptomyces sp. H27-G5]MCY0963443.1 hypothetical protein [Streptomyces sp. H27-H5]
MSAWFGPEVGAALDAAAGTGVAYMAIAYPIRPGADRGGFQGLVRLNLVALSDRYIIHIAEYPADEFNPRKASMTLEREGFDTVLWDDCQRDTWTALAISVEREDW